MQVTMFNAGWLTVSGGLIRAGEDMEEQVRVPVSAFLLETETERILVDTGLHPEAVADADSYYGRQFAVGPFSLEQERTIADQIEVGTLTRVVLTHLHWDHAGGLPLIPDTVPAVVQRVEWDAGHDEAATARNFFQPPDYAGTDRPIELIDGDHDLLGDGSVLLLATPGHTPGHQSVQVGDLVIAGDVVHYAPGLDDHRFPLFGEDHEAQGRSAERLRAMREEGLNVIPSHDPDMHQPGPLPS